MKKKVMIVLGVLFAVALVLFLSRFNKEKWPPDKLFGKILDTGSRYAFVYQTNLSEYYQMSVYDSANTVPLFEDFIDNLIYRTKSDLLFAESVYKKYDKEYVVRGNEELIREITEYYDIKIVNAEIKNNIILVKYKLFIKDDSWCVADSSGMIVAGAQNYYGDTIKAIFEEIRANSNNGNIPLPTVTPGITPLEQ